MSQDPKSQRQFYCRDVIWSDFEQMAAEHDCSVDFLINEAMRYYFESRSRFTRRAAGSGATAKPVPPPPARPKTEPPKSGRLPGAQAAETLYLIYDGTAYPIEKEQFVIGRGSKWSDLAIKDSNISRKHCAVIQRNDTYYIKDLGSTNGIDFNGMRIDNKRIDEGDVFHLCDYELRFTYNP